MARDQTSYLQFLVYLDETGLDVGVQEICRRHHVSTREVYLDGKGPTVTAARIEVWYWLRVAIGKSNSEIGRMFDRDASSVSYALARLHAEAEAMNVVLTRENAPDVARAFAVRTAQNLERAGKNITPRYVRGQRHRAIDDNE